MTNILALTIAALMVAGAVADAGMQFTQLSKLVTDDSNAHISQLEARVQALEAMLGPQALMTESAEGSCSGTCQNIYDNSCSTHYETGLCPGAWYIRCCVGGSSSSSGSNSNPCSGARSPSSLTVTTAGVNLVARFEGFVGHCYKDAVGVWTIGYGHACQYSSDHCGCSSGGNRCCWSSLSQSRAKDLLHEDLNKFASSVRSAVSVPLTGNQFSALVSFAYNVGSGNFRSSTLLRKLNAGDYASVPSELNRWTRAGGKVLPGLVKRRKAEGELFSGC